VKPAIQSGSGITKLTTSSLLTGTTLEKADFKLSGRPLLIEALSETSLFKPVIDRCSLFKISWYASLKSR
jgi:hypothetical protein